MHGFGFRKQHEKTRLDRCNWGFAIFCITGYLLFSIISSVRHLAYASPSEELFEQNLNDVALYLSTYDNRAASVVLSIQRIAQGYQHPDFLKTYQGDIENVLQYIGNNPSRLAQMGLQQYSTLINLLSELSAHKSDIFSMLGAERPQTYIILLQNAAEKRPNGGFFGSFVRVTIADAKITDMKFIDSYVPGITRPDISLEAPSRSQAFLSGDSRITFLASNKFGFTDIDGKNIKKLYDMTYGTDIRGVISVNSKLFSDLLPGFQEKLREWQFKNASIDLIRGEARPNKKELYFNDVNDYLSENKVEVIKSIAKNMDRVIDNRYLQAYFVRTKTDLPMSLQNNGLQTVFSPDTLYLRDYNNSYNKIDSFVQKSVTLVDKHKRVVRESAHDVLSIAGLPPGDYTLHIQYALMIPDRYVHFIEKLQQQYGIQFNLREKHILALFAERSTRGVIYAPQNVTFTKLTGAYKTQSLFTTPFSHNAFYVVENTQNNTIKDVVVSFTLSDALGK